MCTVFVKGEEDIYVYKKATRFFHKMKYCLTISTEITETVFQTGYLVVHCDPKGNRGIGTWSKQVFVSTDNKTFIKVGCVGCIK